MVEQLKKFLSRTAALTLLVAGLLITGARAQAEERIALVVGNGAYTGVGPLDNPPADARLMAHALTEQGFEVFLLVDAGFREMVQGISDFGRRLREAGPDATGLFYYAGHGVQSFGTNFLVPVDASVTNAADLGLVAVEAETVLRQMSSARNRTNIVILDACRNNPFEVLLDMNDNGLAEMKAPTGTYLAYATAPGEVALDGLTGNSPFTTALAENIRQPGQPIEALFKKVRNQVLDSTRGKQTPWDTSSLTREFYFEPPEVLTAEEIAAKQLWVSVRALRDPVQIMLFLRAYPDSRYAAEARTLLAEVMKDELEPQPAPQVATETTTPDPAPVSKAPDADEKSMIDLARNTGLEADYQAYLDVFPEGTYAELARFELQVIRERSTLAATSVPQEAPSVTLPPKTGDEVALTDPEPSPDTLGFDFPLTQDNALMPGFDITAFVAETSPRFPPIEGLPDELWKDQKCASCHNWTADDLCTQAQTYVSVNAERALQKQHPFGGQLKERLRHWANAGCK